MRRLTLVVPGLVWPAPQTLHPARDLPLAALSRLLGRGRRRIGPPISYENLLARLFGMENIAPSLAALRRLGEDGGEERGDKGENAEAHWLCADPVHLCLTREYLLLSDFADGEIDADEARALSAALNDDYAALGHFQAATPTRWYLRLDRPPAARFSPLHDVAGRPIQHFLPAGDEAGARRWRHVLSDIQITLHHHPVNQARAASGRRPVNSLWFWGGGGGPAASARTARAPCPAVQARDPLARGLARAAGVAPEMPDVDAALRTGTLTVLDALAPPARHLDLAVWRETLAAMENDWFAPLMRAFDAGGLRALVLRVPGERADFTLTLDGGARWRFWRRPVTLDDIHARLASLPPPSTIVESG
ncbi:MAG: hypothetical protein LBF50_10035 [Azoarcus sp.]|jgi:hypothetical protein|nr:hypothetical protein [Azoarcus sp.]